MNVLRKKMQKRYWLDIQIQKIGTPSDLTIKFILGLVYKESYESYASLGNGIAKSIFKRLIQKKIAKKMAKNGFIVGLQLARISNLIYLIIQ